jgi:hypothetical protein
MQIGGQTGTGNTKSADGTINNPFRQGNQNQMIVDELHGDCYEVALRGKLYSVANQAAVTTTAALATTWTGLAISNPANSGINLIVRRFSCTQFAVGAAASIGVMAGAGAAAGSLVPQNRLIGGPVSQAVASAGATIATPILIDTYGSVGSLATTGYGLTSGINVELKGSIIVPPGQFLASYTTIVTTSALIFGFVWEEAPV